MKKVNYTIEPNKNCSLVYKKAYQIVQTNDRFCRLYENSKDLENIMPRKRKIETGRLMPRGIIFYGCPDESPLGIVNEAFTIHKRDQYTVLTSGGKDSMTLTHWTATNFPKRFKGCMHIRTGVGIKKTTDWLIKYCEKMNWPLEIRQPKMKGVKDVYEFIVMKYGFPSYGLHRVVMGLLKYHVMRRFTQETPERLEHHALVSGVRAFESVRRMGNYQSPIQRDGRMWFIAPWFKQSDELVYEYLLTNHVQRTPVHDLLGFSGECECGSFAGYGEREKLKAIDPELDEYISKLERDVLVRGTERAKKRPIWGKGFVSKEEADEITAEVFKKMETINDLEEIICGVECGSGTMRGVTNL